jgi:hypothetical protein
MLQMSLYCKHLIIKIANAIKYSNVKNFHFVFHSITVYQENRGFFFYIIIFIQRIGKLQA